MSEEIKFGLFVGQQAREWDPDRLPWKDDSLVALAFKDNKVVARAGIIAWPHIEGLWIDESVQSSLVGPKLLEGIEKALKHFHETRAFAFIDDDRPDIQDYAKRSGFSRIPVHVYVKEL